MIYLLFQMVLALILAAVCGGALGWILHRTTQDRQSDKLKNIINRQRQQLGQLQSEIGMLTDDYDELERQSHDELMELRQANQQIPHLSTNLEKSQLLVSQMLKKHESQVRELNAQNLSLTEKLKKSEQREQAFNKQQADLDSARRSQTNAAQPENTVDDISPDTIIGFDSESSTPIQISEHPEIKPLVSGLSGKAEKSTLTGRTNRVISDARNTSSWASAPLSATPAEGQHRDLQSGSTETSQQDRSLAGGIDTAGSDDTDTTRSDEDLDAVHVVVEDDLQDITDELLEPASDDEGLTEAAIGLTALDSEHSEDGEDDEDDEDDEEFTQTVDNSPVIHLNADASERDAADAAEDDHERLAGLTTGKTVTPDSELELPEIPSDVFDVDPFDQVIEIGDDLQKELDEDDSEEDDLLPFEPVERQDDLQQIFGIGPVTEKALNDLGITSYAQLARLKHHEIETIASALKIVPGRIERDDWVGNARRQLEDVLEEL